MLIQYTIRGLQSGPFFFLQGVMPDKFKKKKRILWSQFWFSSPKYCNNKHTYRKITTYSYTNKQRAHSPEHSCMVIYINPDQLSCYSCHSYSLGQWPLSQVMARQRLGFSIGQRPFAVSSSDTTILFQRVREFYVIDRASLPVSCPTLFTAIPPTTT